MLGWYLYCLFNCFNFSGRAGRKEFWSFFFVNLIIFLILSYAFGDFVGTNISAREPTLADVIGLPASTYYLLTLFPSLAVTTRRVHDRDHSGWWVFWGFFCLLITPIVLFFVALPSLGPNRYGLRAPFSPTDDVPTPYFQGSHPQKSVKGCKDFGIYTNDRTNLYDLSSQRKYFRNQGNEKSQAGKNQLSKSSLKKTHVANDPSFYPNERAYLQSIIDRFDLDIDLDSPTEESKK